MDAETRSHVEAAAQFFDCCGDEHHPRKRREAIRAMLAENDRLRNAAGAVYDRLNQLGCFTDEQAILRHALIEPSANPGEGNGTSP